MNELNPLIEDYMNRFRTALQRYELHDWQDISTELRHHIADALENGKPLVSVLQALGRPDELARAYSLELLIHPPAERPQKVVGRVLTVFGIVAASGIATLVVVTALGSIGVTFIAAGLLCLLIGCLEAAGVHLSFVSMGGVPPLVVIALGPVMLAIGWIALWTLRRYLHFLAGTVRRLISRRATTKPTVTN